MQVYIWACIYMLTALGRIIDERANRGDTIRGVQIRAGAVRIYMYKL